MNTPKNSKINWLSGSLLVVNLLINIAWVMDYLADDWAGVILSAVNVVGFVLIMIFRTWFTKVEE